MGIVLILGFPRKWRSLRDGFWKVFWTSWANRQFANIKCKTETHLHIVRASCRPLYLLGSSDMKQSMMGWRSPLLLFGRDNRHKFWMGWLGASIRNFILKHWPWIRTHQTSKLWWTPTMNTYRTARTPAARLLARWWWKSWEVWTWEADLGVRPIEKGWKGRVGQVFVVPRVGTAWLGWLGCLRFWLVAWSQFVWLVSFFMFRGGENVHRTVLQHVFGGVWTSGACS